MSSSDSTLVVIPARYESSRFPGKPLVEIDGVPMIIRVMSAAVAAFGVDFVVAATDDNRIAQVVRRKGFRAVMTSPSHRTGTDRVAEAVSVLGWDGLVVNVQGDEPLLEAVSIKYVVEAHIRSGLFKVTNAYAPLLGGENPSDRNIPKVVVAGGQLIYMSRAPVPASKDETSQDFAKQVCIYVFEAGVLLEHYGPERPRGSIETREDIEIIRLLEAGVSVGMVELETNSKAVDVPSDVLAVEDILRSRIER